MKTYYFEFQSDCPDMKYEYISYEYIVKAENYDGAYEMAKALNGDKPYHSTNCSSIDDGHIESLGGK